MYTEEIKNALVSKSVKNMSYMYVQCIFQIWASMGENLSWGYANKTGEDQPAQPRSLISAFVIRLLASIISKLAACEMLIF